jgi:hypothetical protein
MWQTLGGWLWKLIGGWLPTGTKPFPEWLGKVLWAVGICVAVNLALNWLSPRQSVTTIGSGGTQIIQQAEPRDMMGFGCSMMRGYIKAGIKAK